jgi:hypothetical protein
MCTKCTVLFSTQLSTQLSADKKEDLKLRKYPHVPSLVPLVIETLGGIGQRGRSLLYQLCERLSVRTNLPVNVMIPRVRKKLLAIMMQFNARMVLASYMMI